MKALALALVVLALSGCEGDDYTLCPDGTPQYTEGGEYRPCSPVPE